MSRKAQLSPAAQADLNEIWSYIAEDSFEAADRFLTFLFGRFAFLAGSPFMGHARDELQAGLRSFPVRNYFVLYRIENAHIEVVRVLSGARDLESTFE